MYINKAILYGNLTRDPEIRALPSGIKVTNFSVATNRRYKDQEGNWKDQADFHNIVAFGKQAETLAQYMKKGRPIFIEGRMQTRSWEDKSSGEKKYRTEVVLDRFQFGADGKGGGTGSKPDEGAGKQQAPDGGNDSSEINYPEEEINAEDIPF